MTDAAIDLFDSHAADYDAARRRLVPPFEAFYGAAVGALGLLGGRAPERVLDLGAGTGLLAACVRAAYPLARLVLLDGSPAMLEQARARLGSTVETLVADLADPLPPGPFDAVVSALAIHHLDDDAKRTLFARACAALGPGGVFVNAEQVAAPTPRLEAAYRAWHHTAARSLGADEREWAGAVERMAADRCADVESQLRWLREAGFEDVDCVFRDHRFAVLVGVRAGA